MKRKERKGKEKLFARNTKELIVELQKQLGVDAVVFSAEHRGSVQITLEGEEVGKTILFSGEDILTDKRVAILIAEDIFLEGFKEKFLESLQTTNKSLQ